MVKMPLSQISKYQEDLCRLFAEYSFSTSLRTYRERNQFYPDKIKSDIFNGKVAEFMVYNYFKAEGKKITFPDIDVYEENEKNYTCDLTINNKYRLHIKNHLKNDLFPVSWVFQKNDPLVKYPKDIDFIVLCVISEDENFMYVGNAKYVLFDEPVKKSLSETKVCIYENKLNQI